MAAAEPAKDPRRPAEHQDRRWPKPPLARVFTCCLSSAECGMNVHHKCQNKVANLCGVNQKLMAEALAIIENKQQVRQRRQ